MTEKEKARALAWEQWAEDEGIEDSFHSTEDEIRARHDYTHGFDAGWQSREAAGQSDTWVRCEDRLPEDFGSYPVIELTNIVHGYTGELVCPRRAWREFGGDGFKSKFKVIAWYSLPPLPPAKDDTAQDAERADDPKTPIPTSTEVTE